MRAVWIVEYDERRPSSGWSPVSTAGPFFEPEHAQAWIELQLDRDYFKYRAVRYVRADELPRKPRGKGGGRKGRK